MEEEVLEQETTEDETDSDTDEHTLDDIYEKVEDILEILTNQL